MCRIRKNLPSIAFFFFLIILIHLLPYVGTIDHFFGNRCVRASQIRFEAWRDACCIIRYVIIVILLYYYALGSRQNNLNVFLICL